jgi:hypothetical protein
LRFLRRHCLCFICACAQASRERSVNEGAW